MVLVKLLRYNIHMVCVASLLVDNTKMFSKVVPMCTPAGCENSHLITTSTIFDIVSPWLFWWV